MNGVTNYTYDETNRILTADPPGGELVSLTYNGADQVVAKQNSAGTRKFVYDGKKLLLETKADDSTELTYDFALSDEYGELNSRYHDATTDTDYYQFDGLGSTDTLSDDAEADVNTYVYRAFGQIESQTGAEPNDFTFVGRVGYWLMQEIDLYFAGAGGGGQSAKAGEQSKSGTLLDPKTGQWLRRDPLRDNPQNLYCYGGNNPIIVTDPSGNAPPQNQTAAGSINIVIQPPGGGDRVAERIQVLGLEEIQREGKTVQILVCHRVGLDGEYEIEFERLMPSSQRHVLKKLDQLRTHARWTAMMEGDRQSAETARRFLEEQLATQQLIAHLLQERSKQTDLQGQKVVTIQIRAAQQGTPISRSGAQTLLQGYELLQKAKKAEADVQAAREQLQEVRAENAAEKKKNEKTKSTEEAGWVISKLGQGEGANDNVGLGTFYSGKVISSEVIPVRNFYVLWQDDDFRVLVNPRRLDGAQLVAALRAKGIEVSSEEAKDSTAYLYDRLAPLDESQRRALNELVQGVTQQTIADNVTGWLPEAYHRELQFFGGVVAHASGNVDMAQMIEQGRQEGKSGVWVATTVAGAVITRELLSAGIGKALGKLTGAAGRRLSGWYKGRGKKILEEAPEEAQKKFLKEIDAENLDDDAVKKIMQELEEAARRAKLPRVQGEQLGEFQKQLRNKKITEEQLRETIHPDSVEEILQKMGKKAKGIHDRNKIIESIEKSSSEAAKAAQDLAEGRISQSEYEKIVDKLESISEAQKQYLKQRFTE